MKIRNSHKTFQDHFLRRMTSWCAKQIGMPVNYLKVAVFRNSRSAFGGCARQWRSQITVCVGDEKHFPCGVSTHREGDSFADTSEALVAVTAHELFHIEAGRVGSDHFQSTRGTRGHSSEAATCKEECRVLDLFRQAREQLIPEWSELPVAYSRPTKSKLDVARENLDRWNRKLKLATTKVRKAKAKVTRLEKAALLPKQEPKQRKQREKKESVFVLAERHGIHIDPHNRGEWWVYPPGTLDNENTDPFAGDHLAFGKKDVRNRVEKYIEALKKLGGAE